MTDGKDPERKFDLKRRTVLKGTGAISIITIGTKGAAASDRVDGGPRGGPPDDDGRGPPGGNGPPDDNGRGPPDKCECPDEETFLAKYDFEGCEFALAEGEDVVDITDWESKEDEECEPITVEYESDGYRIDHVCSFGGRDTHELDRDEEAWEDGVFDSDLENPGGQQAAISNITFCGEEEDCIDPEVTEWDETGDLEEAGGPVILMGLDSEEGQYRPSHGTPEEHADMVESLLDSVTNDGEGILVLGDDGDSSQVRGYWEGDIGDNVGEEVTFVSGADGIRDQSFDDFAMIGIVSSENELQTGGLTGEENRALGDRSSDLADFVNNGGSLLGKTQFGLDNAWGYVDPFGTFENEEETWASGGGFSSIVVEQAGLDLGLTQEGMDGWCCYHEVFLDYPDFFDVLITHDDGGTYEGEAAAIGGEQVIIEREVSLSITGPTTVEVGNTQSYNVELENQSDEAVDGEFELEVTAGDGSMDDTLPTEVGLDPGENNAWDDAIEVTCDSEGALEGNVRFIEDDIELVEVSMEIECVDQCVNSP